MRLNLNADLGESFGAWRMGNDAELLDTVDSANVACGFHAGDPLTLLETVRRAAALGVSIGAHPSFPDLQGFGRRPMSMTPEELEAAVIYQLGALAGACQVAGCHLTHVKPHGALNNLACEDRALANQITSAVAQFDSQLILLAPALSALADAGVAAGLPVALEVFADRTYTESGTLVARHLPGAVIDNAEECIRHVMGMIDAGGIVTQGGNILHTAFSSICVHGDTEHAVATASALRSALSDTGHDLVALAPTANSIGTALPTVPPA